MNDGLCQLDFSKEFLNKIDGQDFRLNAIGGIVNSLTELSDIQRVRITVDGKLIEEEPDGVVLMNEMTAKPDFGCTIKENDMSRPLMCAGAHTLELFGCR